MSWCGTGWSCIAASAEVLLAPRPSSLSPTTTDGRPIKAFSRADREGAPVKSLRDQRRAGWNADGVERD